MNNFRNFKLFPQFQIKNSHLHELVVLILTIKKMSF